MPDTYYLYLEKSLGHEKNTLILDKPDNGMTPFTARFQSFNIKPALDEIVFSEHGQKLANSQITSPREIGTNGSKKQVISVESFILAKLTEYLHKTYSPR